MSTVHTCYVLHYFFNKSKFTHKCTISWYFQTMFFSPTQGFVRNKPIFPRPSWQCIYTLHSELYTNAHITTGCPIEVLWGNSSAEAKTRVPKIIIYQSVLLLGRMVVSSVLFYSDYFLDSVQCSLNKIKQFCKESKILSLVIFCQRSSNGGETICT